MVYAEQYIEKLRKSGLRPTKQRIKICEVLFDAEKTFHFTIKELVKIIENQANIKVSLATVYNTVHAFIKKGYLKEIPLNASQSYYDTNVTHHHHFFDEEENRLISGSVLCGHLCEGPLAYLSSFSNQLTVIREANQDDREFLNWLRPEIKKHSSLRMFLTSAIKNYKYKKAGVLLSGFCDESEIQETLFDKNYNHNTDLMSALDSINKKYGRDTVQLASECQSGQWRQKRKSLTQNYTTQIDKLPLV